MAKQPEKQLDLPTPASATTTPSLPMQLHLGDRYTDEEGGWEIAMRPWTTHGGKLVHASVQKSGDRSTKRDKTWERMSGWRLGGPNVTLVPPKPSTNGQRRNVMRQRLAASSIAMFLGLLGSVPCTEALPFVTVGDGWDGPGLGSANLTYYFGVPTPDLSLNLQHTALVAALDAWASIVAVTFKETSIAHQPRSIDFNFETNGVSSGFLA